MRPSLRRISIAPIVLCALLLVPALSLADTGVVMKDGSVVKCQKYEQKGNVYVLTMANGKLVSLRADKVDAEATAGFEEKMKAQAEAEAQMKAAAATAPPPKETKPAEKGPAVALTNDDLKKYEGQPSSMGDNSSVTAEAGDMPDRKDYEALEKKGQGDEGKAAPATPAAPKGGEGKSDKGDGGDK